MIRTKIGALGLAVAFAGSLVSIAGIAAPASAEPQCGSNGNIWHVRARLGAVIDQLNHDRHDYGGHRDAAISDLSNAKRELERARMDAVRHDGSNPGCFSAPQSNDGFEPEVFGQGNSDRFLHGMERYLGRLEGQLSNDNHDYAGHRVAAVQDMQAARGELNAALQFAHQRGH